MEQDMMNNAAHSLSLAALRWLNAMIAVMLLNTKDTLKLMSNH